MSESRYLGMGSVILLIVTVSLCVGFAALAIVELWPKPPTCAEMTSRALAEQATEFNRRMREIAR